MMLVLLSLLAPGCQTHPGLTKVTRQQPQRPSSEQWPCSYLSLLKAFLWGELGAEESALEWAQGTLSQLPVTLLLWQTHLLCLRADMWWQWQGWGIWWKGTEKWSDWLPACLWGECWRLSATITFLYCKHTHAHIWAYTHGYYSAGWPSALSHTQISIWVKVAALLDIL